MHAGNSYREVKGDYLELTPLMFKYKNLPPSHHCYGYKKMPQRSRLQDQSRINRVRKRFASGGRESEACPLQGHWGFSLKADLPFWGNTRETQCTDCTGERRSVSPLT